MFENVTNIICFYLQAYLPLWPTYRNYAKQAIFEDTITN
jgi:hypothetical protein